MVMGGRTGAKPATRHAVFEHVYSPGGRDEDRVPACVLVAALFVAGFVAFIRLPERNGREPYRFKTVSAATLEAADIQLLPPKSPELAVSRAEALKAFAREGVTQPREVVLTDIRYREFGPDSALDTYFAWVAVTSHFVELGGPLRLPGQLPPAPWPGDTIMILNAAHPDAGMGSVGIGAVASAKN